VVKNRTYKAYYAPKVPLKFPRFPDEIERPYKSSGPIPRGEAEVLAFRRNLPIKQDAHSLIRNWAFWLLFVVALSLSIILGIADLRAVVFPSGAIVLACAVIVAWIFVLSHAIGPTFTLMSKRKRRESRD
jgi:hypothetical protein